MNNEEKILAILEIMQSDISGLKSGVTGLKSDITGLKADVTGLKAGQAKLEEGQAKLESDMTSVKGIVTRIENDHGAKLGALYDGYVQNAARLDRIEEKVSTQDEFVLRKVFPK